MHYQAISRQTRTRVRTAQLDRRQRELERELANELPQLGYGHKLDRSVILRAIILLVTLLNNSTQMLNCERPSIGSVERHHRAEPSRGPPLEVAFLSEDEPEWDRLVGVMLDNSAGLAHWGDLVLGRWALALTGSERSRQKRDLSEDSLTSNHTELDKPRQLIRSTFSRYRPQLNVTHMRLTDSDELRQANLGTGVTKGEPNVLKKARRARKQERNSRRRSSEQVASESSLEPDMTSTTLAPSAESPLPEQSPTEPSFAEIDQIAGSEQPPMEQVQRVLSRRRALSSAGGPNPSSSQSQSSNQDEDNQLVDWTSTNPIENLSNEELQQLLHLYESSESPASRKPKRSQRREPPPAGQLTQGQSQTPARLSAPYASLVEPNSLGELQQLLNQRQREQSSVAPNMATKLQLVAANAFDDHQPQLAGLMDDHFQANRTPSDKRSKYAQSSNRLSSAAGRAPSQPGKSSLARPFSSQAAATNRHLAHLAPANSDYLAIQEAPSNPYQMSGNQFYPAPIEGQPSSAAQVLGLLRAASVPVSGQPAARRLPALANQIGQGFNPAFMGQLPLRYGGTGTTMAHNYMPLAAYASLPFTRGPVMLGPRSTGNPASPDRYSAASQNRIGRNADSNGPVYDDSAPPASGQQQAAASPDPMWSDTQNQQEDYQQSPQTIQITAVPNGVGLNNGFGNGWGNGWNGWNGWNGRQVLLVNRQPNSEWRNWVLPVAAILALPLVLGAMFVPVFLKSVMFLIQILQMLGLLMPPAQLAGHLSTNGAISSSG